MATYLRGNETIENAITNNDNELRLADNATAYNTTVTGIKYDGFIPCTMYLSDYSTAYNTTIKDDGYLHMSGDATIYNTTIQDDGFMAVCDETIAYNTTVYDGSLSVTHNATLYNTVIKGGNLGISFFEDEYDEGDEVKLYNTTIKSGKLFIQHDVSVCDTLNISKGVFVSVKNDSTINLNLTERSSQSSYLVTNLDLIPDGANYTITVKDDQQIGTYKLADGAKKFNETISIGNGTVEYGELTVNGNIISCNGYNYRLTRESRKLLLKIEIDKIAPALRCKVSAANSSFILTFDTDATDAEHYEIRYSTDGITYSEYETTQENTFTVNDSDARYFQVRAVDKVGNVSAWKNISFLLTDDSPQQIISNSKYNISDDTYTDCGKVAATKIVPKIKESANSYSYKADAKTKGTLTIRHNTGTTEFLRFATVKVEAANVGDISGGKESSSENTKSTVDKKGTITDTGKLTYSASANGKFTALNASAKTVSGYATVNLTASKADKLSGGSEKVSISTKTIDAADKDQKNISKTIKSAASGSATLKNGASVDALLNGYSKVTLTDSTAGNITNFTSKDSKSETATYNEAKNTVTRKVTLSHTETTAGTLKANDSTLSDVTGFATVTLKNVTGGADFRRLDEAGEKYSTVKKTLNVKTNKNGSVTGTYSKTETFTRAGKFNATGSVVGDIENFSNVTLNGSAAGAVSNFETAKIVTRGTALWSDMYAYGRPEDYDLNLDAMDLKVTETKSLNGSVTLKNHAYAESIDSFQKVTMTGSDVGTISKVTKVTINKGDSYIGSYIGTNGNDTFKIAKGAVLTANQINLGAEVKDTLAISGTLILTGTEVNAFKITGKGEIAAESEVFADLDVAFANTLDVGETSENFRGTAYEKADNSFKKAVKWNGKEEYNGWLGDWNGYTAGSDMVDHIKFKAKLGDELIVDGISDGNWTLLDKKGNQIINENIFANNEFQLAGEYILKLENASDNPSVAYTITLA